MEEKLMDKSHEKKKKLILANRSKKNLSKFVFGYNQKTQNSSVNCKKTLNSSISSMGENAKFNYWIRGKKEKFGSWQFEIL